jgi:hypothetical protein
MNLYRLTALYVNVYQICSLFAFEVDCLTFSRLIQMQKWSTGWTVRADLMAKESRSSCSQPFRLPAAFLCVCFSRLITASFKARFILFSWNSPSYDVVNVSNWFGGLWLIMCPGERPFQGYLLHISIQCPSIERTSFLNCWLALTVPSPFLGSSNWINDEMACLFLYISVVQLFRLPHQMENFSQRFLLAREINVVMTSSSNFFSHSLQRWHRSSALIAPISFNFLVSWGRP